MRELSQVYDTQFFSGMGIDKNGKRFTGNGTSQFVCEQLTTAIQVRYQC